MVLMIYWQEVYTQDPEDGGKAEVLIRKQRNGPLGTVRLQFDASGILFRNYEPGMAPEYEDYD